MGRELIQFGHLCSLVLPQDLRPGNSGAGFDVIINVRPAQSVHTERNNSRRVGQDYVYGTNLPYEENAQPNDIAYTFGDPLIQGLPKIWKHWRGLLRTAWLNLGCSSGNRGNKTLILSSLGCTFPNIYEWMNPQLNEYMSAHAEEYYKPLSNSLCDVSASPQNY